jgi:hypothetical protein
MVAHAIAHGFETHTTGWHSVILHAESRPAIPARRRLPPSGNIAVRRAVTVQ